MNFTEALAKLQQGNYVKRAAWNDGYLCLMPDMQYIWRILTAPNPNCGNFMPSMSDFLADDWQDYTGGVSLQSPEVPQSATGQLPNS
jgi:uncharacterized protein DUF2829